MIKERKKELLLHLFSRFVSAFVFSQAEARCLDNNNVCCFLCVATLQAVFELSSLTYLAFVLKKASSFQDSLIGLSILQWFLHLVKAAIYIYGMQQV